MNTFAVETDTKLADAHRRYADAAQRTVWAADALRRNAGQKRTRDGRWSGTVAEALFHHEGSTNAWDVRDVNEYWDRLAVRVAIQGEIDALEAQYTRVEPFLPRDQLKRPRTLVTELPDLLQHHHVRLATTTLRPDRG